MKKHLLFSVCLGALTLAAGWAQADVHVGIGAPLTGGGAAYGEQMKRGVEAAVAKINAAGGMNGEKIVIHLGDDVSDPRQGISVANKFIADGVQFVVGHFNSGVSIPVSEVYAENGILMVAPGTTNPVYTDRGLWNTFRTCRRDDNQAVAASEYIAKTFKGKNIAIAHDKTPYGQGLADGTKAALNDLGVKEVAYEGVNVGEKDYSALISKLKRDNVDVLYWGGLHPEAGLIIRQMKDQGLDAVFISGDGIVSSELVSIAGDAVAGVLNTFGPDPRDNPQNKELIEEFRSQGFEPEAYTLYSYAAMTTIADAANAAGTNDPQKVAEAMKEKGPFQTVLGELSYDSKGDPDLSPYVIFEWRKGDDGKYSYYQKYD